MNKNSYGPVIDNLLAINTEMTLDGGEENSRARPLLDALTIDSAFSGQKIRDHELAECCVSGLWLRHNFLDESHTISQGIHSVEGSYWHGIMHRREPDFWNSKYWFRKVGHHDVFEALHQFSLALNYATKTNEWDPYSYIDFCEACYEGSNSKSETALKIQQHEWELLFDFCFQSAVE